MDIVEPNDPTLGQAMEALAGMETADASSEATAPASQEAASATTEAERAASTDEAKVQPPKADATDGAPATEDSKKPDDKTVEPKDGVKAEEKPVSRFEKNRTRLEGGWKELNAEKTTVRTMAETLKQRESELAKRETAIKQAEAKASAPKYTPDDYERAATQFEAQGKYDLADAAREQAKDLRANPPKPAPTDAEAEARYQSEQKEWWGKAATDFPAVAKQGSPEHSALQALIKAEPGVLNDPKGLYYAARLVAAETSAASVPALTKQVGELSAKVKELQGKLTIPADGSPPGATRPLSFEQKSEAEQEAELYSQAQEIGRFN